VAQPSLATKASIPEDGSSGAYGYGIITGTGVVIVTTPRQRSPKWQCKQSVPSRYKLLRRDGCGMDLGDDPSLVAHLITSFWIKDA
jgi:hypothetical protein